MIGRSRVVTFFLVLAVAGLSFLAGMVAFNFIMAYSVKHGEEITIPQLEGLALAEAELLARQANLRVRKVGERFSGVVPPGFVLEQSPPAGRRVKVGRRISVIVSGGRETVQVPDLVGIAVRRAIVGLDGEGLELGKVARCSAAGMKADDVIASSPPPGMILERGSRVDLLVSLGPPSLRFVMPDLAGREEDPVQRYLRGLGLSVLVSKEFRPGRGTGPWTIIRHVPPAGTMMAEGDTVRLTIGVR